MLDCGFAIGSASPSAKPQASGGAGGKSDGPSAGDTACRNGYFFGSRGAATWIPPPPGRWSLRAIIDPAGPSRSLVACSADIPWTDLPSTSSSTSPGLSVEKAGPLYGLLSPSLST